MTSDLLSLLRHELRNTPGQISTQAAALCKVIWQQFQITWQHQNDQLNEYRTLKARVGILESRIATLEKDQHPE